MLNYTEHFGYILQVLKTHSEILIANTFPLIKRDDIMWKSNLLIFLLQKYYLN